METLTYSGQLVIEHCINCGVKFAMPKELHDRLQDVGPKQSFYCPNGHPMVFRYSEVEQENIRLKKEADYLRQAKESLHNQLTEKEQTIGKLNRQITNRNKRLKAGVCPCCNRTFKELAAHMQNKHPEYTGKIKQPNILHQKISIKGAITKS